MSDDQSLVLNIWHDLQKSCSSTLDSKHKSQFKKICKLSLPMSWTFLCTHCKLSSQMSKLSLQTLAKLSSQLFLVSLGCFTKWQFKLPFFLIESPWSIDHVFYLGLWKWKLKFHLWVYVFCIVHRNTPISHLSQHRFRLFVLLSSFGNFRS